MRLTNKDYKRILAYYNVPIPKNKKKIVPMAEKLLATKLCHCIKDVTKKIKEPKEKGATAICTTSVLKNRRLKKKKFTCKKAYKITGLTKTHKLMRFPGKKSK